MFPMTVRARSSSSQMFSAQRAIKNAYEAIYGAEILLLCKSRTTWCFYTSSQRTRSSVCEEGRGGGLNLFAVKRACLHGCAIGV